MMDFSKSLNEEQKQAVFHGDGPMVVFAGAGSGKTRVITTRIAHLIQSGTPSRKILAVTFTNKAAQEMRHRIVGLCGNSGISCHIATFHSACAKWLREYANELGFSSDFTIFDEDDSNAALKSILKSVVDKTDLSHSVEESKKFIHYVKLKGWFPFEVEKHAQDRFLQPLIPTVGVSIYRKYQDYLVQCNAMDFDDLLMNMLLLLRKNERVKAHMQKRYDHILVDEYQDTNAVQFELLSILAERTKNICVVGDDDQSIYSWRGAVPKNILNFEKQFPGAKVILLQQNYRCTKTIVDAAAALIANNKVRAPKVLRTDNPLGDKITVKIEESSDDEANRVAKDIMSERNRFTLDEVAVFYRTNAQSRALEEAFRKNSIPYRIFGSLKFYDRLEIKDMLAYIRILVNSKDDVSVRRVVNVPTRGLGDTAQQQIEDYARKNSISLWEACVQLAEDKTFKNAKKIQSFVSRIFELQQELPSISLGSVVDRIAYRVDYKAYIEKKFPDQALDKLENIAELAESMERFDQQNQNQASLAQWLNEIALFNSSDTEDEELSEASVSMMSLHLAKGLEYDRVFVVGVEEGILPHRSTLDFEDQIEEERRLFYVGVTRARKKLSVFAAFERKMFDKRTQNKPSRFLNEIPPELIEYVANSYFEERVDVYSGTQYDYEDSALMPKTLRIQKIRQGARVFHPTYGYGVVEGLEQGFGSTKVCVDFYDFGKRKVEHRHLREGS